MKRSQVDFAIEAAKVDAAEQRRPMVVRFSGERSIIIGPSRGVDPRLVVCTVHPDGRVEHEPTPSRAS